MAVPGNVVCTWDHGRETGWLGWPRCGNSVGLHKDRVQQGGDAAGKAGIMGAQEMRVGGRDPVASVEMPPFPLCLNTQRIRNF